MSYVPNEAGPAYIFMSCSTIKPLTSKSCYLRTEDMGIQKYMKYLEILFLVVKWLYIYKKKWVLYTFA